MIPTYILALIVATGGYSIPQQSSPSAVFNDKPGAVFTSQWQCEQARAGRTNMACLALTIQMPSNLSVKD